MLLATSLAFSTIFALVPMVALFMAVSKLSGNFVQFAQDFRDGLLNYITAGAGEDLVDQLTMILNDVEPTGMGIFGVLGLLFTSTKMIYDLDTTIVRIWHEHRSTRWWKRIFVYIAILVISPLVLSALAGILDWDILNQFFSVFLTSASVLLFASLYISFKFAPPEPISKRAALSGALFTYLLLTLGKELYTWSTANMFSYNKLYGSLAFLPLFLFWLFFVWCFILGGLALTKAVDDVISGKTAEDLRQKIKQKS